MNPKHLTGCRCTTACLCFAAMVLGCGKQELRATRVSREVRQWVTNGTSIASAQQILQSHNFTCSVAVYTNRQSMVDGTPPHELIDAHYFDTRLWIEGKSVAVTNITHLNFKQTNCSGSLTYLNGRYEGGVQVFAVGQ